MKAVIMYGPPGSGKGTQGELLARRYNFIHFDTGRYLERILRAPGSQKDPVLFRERKIFDSGVLCTPTWVLKIVKESTMRIAKADYSIVYTGSPRTVFEAFGDKHQKGLIAALGKLYGKNNLYIIELSIRASTSIKRNSQRFVCSLCGLPILAGAKSKHCLFCAAPLRKRSVDNAEVIKVRLREYRGRTYPILARARDEGYLVFQIKAELPPYRVFKKVVKALGLK